MSIVPVRGSLTTGMAGGTVIPSAFEWYHRFAPILRDLARHSLHRVSAVLQSTVLVYVENKFESV